MTWEREDEILDGRCSVCFLSSFNEAVAATYEVLPSVSNSLASGTQTYYWAQVLDKHNGKIFACSVKFDRTAKHIIIHVS